MIVCQQSVVCHAVPIVTVCVSQQHSAEMEECIVYSDSRRFIALMVGFRGAKEDLKLANSLEFKAAPDGFVQQERGHPGVMVLTYSICFYTRATPTIYLTIILHTFKSPGDGLHLDI